MFSYIYIYLCQFYKSGSEPLNIYYRTKLTKIYINIRDLSFYKVIEEYYTMETPVVFGRGRSSGLSFSFRAPTPPMAKCFETDLDRREREFLERKKKFELMRSEKARELKLARDIAELDAEERKFELEFKAELAKINAPE